MFVLPWEVKLKLYDNFLAVYLYIVFLSIKLAKLFTHVCICLRKTFLLELQYFDVSTYTQCLHQPVMVRTLDNSFGERKGHAWCRRVGKFLRPSGACDLCGNQRNETLRPRLSEE